MEAILFLAYTEADGTLGKPSLEALTAAQNLALPEANLTVGLIGAQVQPAANQIASCGATRFLAVEGPAFGQARYATDAAAAEAICRAAGAALVVSAATHRGNRSLPGVALRLQGRAETHVTGLARTAEGLTISRWYYRQRMEAALRRSQRPWILLLDPGTHAAWNGAAGSVQPEILTVEVPDTLQRTTVLRRQQVGTDTQTIRPDAKLLFVAGAGWTKKQSDGQTHLKEAEALILGFLQATRASLGSSKSLVDLSSEGQAVLPFLTHMNQIGQTGATPRHPRGLATCCHGEEPHTVGWRFITERRAINLDPNCGWARGKADVLYVADAFAVMAKVNEMLTQGQ